MCTHCCTLCDPAEAASKGVVTRSAFMEYTLRCISVQLPADNHVLRYQLMLRFPKQVVMC